MKLSHLLLLGFALSVALLGADPRTQLALVVQFSDRVPASVKAEMEREVRETVETEWLGVTWKESPRIRPDEDFSRVVIIKVNGACRAGVVKRGGSLGFTHVSDGKVLPFIELNCSRVANMIERRVFPRGPLPPAPALGKALGRVAAHELYHVLSNTQSHGEEGLAKSEFGEMDLLLPASFAATDRRRIESELLRQDR